MRVFNPILSARRLRDAGYGARELWESPVLWERCELGSVLLGARGYRCTGTRRARNASLLVTSQRTHPEHTASPSDDNQTETISGPRRAKVGGSNEATCEGVGTDPYVTGRQKAADLTRNERGAMERLNRVAFGAGCAAVRSFDCSTAT